MSISKCTLKSGKVVCNVQEYVGFTLDGKRDRRKVTCHSPREAKVMAPHESMQRQSRRALPHAPGAGIPSPPPEHTARLACPVGFLFLLDSPPGAWHYISCTRRYLSWIEGLTTNQNVTGSNPVRRTICRDEPRRGLFLYLSWPSLRPNLVLPSLIPPPLWVRFSWRVGADRCVWVLIATRTLVDPQVAEGGRGRKAPTRMRRHPQAPSRTRSGARVPAIRMIGRRRKAYAVAAFRLRAASSRSSSTMRRSYSCCSRRRISRCWAMASRFSLLRRST